MSGPAKGAGIGPTGASLTDILTAIGSLFKTLAGVGKIIQQMGGTSNSGALAATTLVQSGPTRLVSVSVTTAGSASGVVYDSASASATQNPVFVISNVLGVKPANIPLSYGLVVAPGTGMTVTAVYS